MATNDGGEDDDDGRLDDNALKCNWQQCVTLPLERKAIKSALLATERSDCRPKTEVDHFMSPSSFEARSTKKAWPVYVLYIHTYVVTLQMKDHIVFWPSLVIKDFRFMQDLSLRFFFEEVFLHTQRPGFLGRQHVKVSVCTSVECQTRGRSIIRTKKRLFVD